MLDLKDTCKQVQVIAMMTGEVVESMRRQFDRESVEEKSAHNYVSYVDKESEQRLVDELSLLLPGSGFITEEGTAGLSQESYYWIIDPLDGTTNYIHDMAPYCISIALCNREETLLGVVYEVCRKECFYAWKGSPAYRDGEEIRVSDVTNFDQAFIALGFPYNSDNYGVMARRLVDRLYGFVGGTRLLGSAAAELCYVACGRFDARIEGFLGSWDVAAAGFILQQAGGKLTDFKGGDTWISGDEVVASNGALHETIMQRLIR